MTWRSAALFFSALLSAACEARNGDASSASSPGEGIQALPTIERMGETVHAGVRRVEIYNDGETLVFRERLVVGGEGRFGLEPLEAPSGVDADWIYRQRIWGRYSFLYRDFAIRDWDLFLRNWRLVDLGEERVVAGRICARYLVERKDGGKRYDLAVDVETGLVLRSEERDGQGRLLALVEYESFDPQPDLQSAVWTKSLVDEHKLELGPGLRQELGDARLPKRLPAGFELLEASQVMFQGRSWVKLVYGDGVESVFFLSTLASGVQASSATPGSQLVSARLGSVNIVQAVLGSELLMAIGEMDEDKLADLVESALP